MSSKKLVKCAVGFQGTDGPNLAFVKVLLEKEEYENGDHYDAAKEFVRGDLDGDGPMWVVDEHDPAYDVLGLCEDWAKVKTVDITGEPLTTTEHVSAPQRRQARFTVSVDLESSVFMADDTFADSFSLEISVAAKLPEVTATLADVQFDEILNVLPNGEIDYEEDDE
jgi:hypothetical protein